MGNFFIYNAKQFQLKYLHIILIKCIEQKTVRISNNKTNEWRKKKNGVSNNNNTHAKHTTVFVIVADCGSCRISLSCVAPSTTTTTTASWSSVDVSLSIHKILFVCERLYSFNDSMTLKWLCFDVVLVMFVAVVVAVAVGAGWLLVSFRLIVTAACVYYQCWHSTAEQKSLFGNDVHDANAHRLSMNQSLSLGFLDVVLVYRSHANHKYNTTKRTNKKMPLFIKAKW